MRIGEIAKNAGIGVETVRFYELKGLISQPLRPENGGYRDYPVDTVHRIRFIRSAQQLGFSLQEINDSERQEIAASIADRERSLLPVYEQISVQFCELHDTPGRMKAVGVIRQEVDWKSSRAFFYWRLRRKLAEFDLRKKIKTQ